MRAKRLAPTVLEPEYLWNSSQSMGRCTQKVEGKPINGAWAAECKVPGSSPAGGDPGAGASSEL